jgi:hypothetical protein
LWVTEAEVVLAQPARTMVLVGKGQKSKKKQVEVPGPPLTPRLIVVQVRRDKDRNRGKTALVSSQFHFARFDRRH